MVKKVEGTNLRLRKAMDLRGIKQVELVEKSGLPKSSISQYLSGVREPKQKAIYILSEILEVAPGWLMGYDVPMIDRETPPRLMIDDSVIVPVLGKVAAGIPLFAEENIVGQIRCSEEMAAGCELFALKVEGDSMLPRIHDGDILIVRQQDDADSGDIVIALVNGDDGCVKKLVKYDSGGCALISLNPVYEPMVFDKAAVYEVPVRIIGKVIEVRSPM